MPPVKVTIVGGAGGVGASTAFNLALMRGGHEVVLVDNRPEMSTSHVMDLEQVLEQSPGCTLRGGETSDVRYADVVVLLSATPLTAGTPRVEYLAQNALIADDLADALGTPWHGSLVVVTNPVDPLVTRLLRRTGLDRRRILGTRSTTACGCERVSPKRWASRREASRRGSSASTATRAFPCSIASA
jgi:malate dehydrogenase